MSFFYSYISVRHIRIHLVILVSIMLLSNVGFSQDIYVSPYGKDTGNGTKENPYTSIEKALKNIVQLRSEKEAHQITIYLRGGVYTIHHTINIDSSLSDILIRAYRKEKVTLSGGVNIPTSSVYLTNLPGANGGGLQKVHAINLRKAGISDYGEIHHVGFLRPCIPAWGEIFVNGKPLHLARWPNKGMIPMGKVLDKGSVPRNNDFTNRGGVIKYDSLRINRWAKEKDAWMAGYFMYGYADDMVKIENIDSIKKTITTASAALYGYGSGKPWTRWYGVNILSELDTLGEYYIDRQKGILYFIPAVTNIKSLSFSILETPFFCWSMLRM